MEWQTEKIADATAQAQFQNAMKVSAHYAPCQPLQTLPTSPELVIEFRDSIHAEVFMLIFRSVRSMGYAGLAILLLCALTRADNSPANVAGTWSVSVTNGRRSAKQTFVLQQDGVKITGTFKGPRQSGTIDGAVDGTHITFHVTAKIPLDYKGTISGDATNMQGTFEGDGKTGDWIASRSR